MHNGKAKSSPLIPHRTFDYLVERFMVFVATVVPLKVGYALGRVVAEAVFYLWESKREAARRNYARVLGVSPADRRTWRFARIAFRNFGRYIVEIFRLQALPPERTAELLDIRNHEALDETVARGKGVIFVSAHIGNMEVASTALSFLGHEVMAPYEPVKPEFLMRYLLHMRRRRNVLLVPLEQAGFRLLRALRRRKLVALVADLGVKQSGGVRVRFFGGETLLPAGPAGLARMTGAPILFGCAIHNRRNRYDLYIGEPIEPVRTDDEARDLQVMTQQIADQLEALIRSYPEQWYIFRDMWPVDGELPDREPFSPATQPAT